MIPEYNNKSCRFNWWAPRQEPPSNRQDSFKNIVKKDNRKRKNKRNCLKGKK